jgi:plastocyanin
MTRLRLPILALCLAVATLIVAAKEPDKAKGANHTVTMRDKKYAPASLTVKVGDTVVWTNNDEHDHTVVADDKSFKSGNIGAGDSFGHAFEKKGKFSYSCSYHPRMKGTITVE